MKTKKPIQPDFDQIIERVNTKSAKFDTKETNHVPEDAIPMWVADMDFPTPEPVREKLKEIVDYGIFGYSIIDTDYKDAVLDWFDRRFDYHPNREEMIQTPGVVNAIIHAIRAFTEEGDKILIQPPVYYPFKHSVENNNRVVVENPLIEENGIYTIDFDGFKEAVKDEDVKAFILSNPHNPVGRVFTEEELKKMAELCLENNVLIISDEIHQDFIHPGHKHVVLPTLGEEIADNTILCTAPSKTFNLAGLQASNIFIKNEDLRKRYKKELEQTGVHGLNLLANWAAQTAYSEGEEWLEELKAYIKDNIDYVNDFLTENIPEITASPVEGTYLMWLDCRNLGMNDKELKDFFLENAHLWLDEGTLFGTGGSGFMRINLAAPRATVEKAMNSLKIAVDEKRKN